jgi:hypothetical protein
MLTVRQKELIEALSKEGYGWAKFACSVERQGWCSFKQEATMEKMLKRVVLNKKMIGADFDNDLSDYEAYSVGEYF